MKQLTDSLTDWLRTQAMLLFLAGGKTEPIQTLLFMQASIPLSALLSSTIYGTRCVSLCVILLLWWC